ncbi:MAG: endonuclease [Ferruginibacter sp.]|nr:endonuclease [Ferruginibacter sp.]
MPEGPSLFIIRGQLKPFVGKKIVRATGNAKIDMDALQGAKILDIKTWGKQLFFILKKQTVRIHFMMFGSFSIDEQTKPDRQLRLHLAFKQHSLFFYTCSVRLVEDPTESYDWEADVMNENWNPVAARKKLKAVPSMMVCDALLDQSIFSGVGNIIKNEVLYRIKLHPQAIIGHLPARILTSLIKEARNYSFDFLEWKKAFVLRKHWLAHTKKTCHRCDLPFTKAYCGKTKRRSFFCENCQMKFE